MLLQFDLAEARRYLPGRWQKQVGYLRGPIDREPIERCFSIAARQQTDIDRFSVPNLTHYEDRNSMAFGLEIRLPFLDSRLVDFTLSLPTDQKIRHGWTKYILRRSQSRLPKKIRWRRDKQSFVQPEAKWVKHDLSGVIRGIMNCSVLAQMGVLDGKAFLEHYDNFQAGKKHVWYAEISRVFLAELWARKHFGVRQTETLRELQAQGERLPGG